MISMVVFGSSEWQGATLQRQSTNCHSCIPRPIVAMPRIVPLPKLVVFPAIHIDNNDASLAIVVADSFDTVGAALKAGKMSSAYVHGLVMGLGSQKPSSRLRNPEL